MNRGTYKGNQTIMALVTKGGKRWKSNETDNARADSIDSIFADCSLPLTPTRIFQSFTITTDSYISLCSRMYDALCLKHTDFRFTVSESHFQYWAVILLWQRFAQILPHSETTKSALFQEIKHLPNTARIPDLLSTYLEGIGHFRDPHGSERKLVLPSIPMATKISGIPYTFGQVNADTHSLYEAFPAPGIAFLRILADIQYTKNPELVDNIWNLPTELRPLALDSKLQAIKPTRNLLGWAPAQLLTENQLEYYQSLKIDEIAMEKNHRDISVALLNVVINKLHTYSSYGQLTDDKTGSLAQGMTVKRHYELPLFNNSDMYCEGIVSVSTPYMLNGTVDKNVLLTGYRMIKEPIGGRHCWSCYDFDEYKDVPESWIQSRNMIYNYGCVGGLNECVYTTGYTAKRQLQNEYIRRTMFTSDDQWNIYM